MANLITWNDFVPITLKKKKKKKKIKVNYILNRISACHLYLRLKSV